MGPRKRVMPSWMQPLDKNVFSHAQVKPHRICNGNWFPEKTKIVVGKCGSVDREIICMVAHHINEHARKTVTRGLPILLLIDGHSSRNSPAWLDVCQKSNIVVVRLQENTTHILQPCDQSTNKTFQRAVRSTRDEILALSHFKYAKNAFKVKLAVVGHQAITPDIARRSFEECGMWPMKFQFMAPFCGEMSPKLHVSSPLLPSSDISGQNSNVPSSLSARSENQKLMRKIHNLSGGCLPSGKALAEIAMLVKTKYRLNKVLEKVVRPPKTAPSQVKRGSLQKQSKKAAVLISALQHMPLSVISMVQLTCDSTGVQRNVCSNDGDINDVGKENYRPQLSEFPAEALGSEFDDCLEDIPISKWPRNRAFVSGAPQRDGKSGRTQSAARTLLHLSHYR